MDRDSYSDCESTLSEEDESDQHVIFTELNARRSNDGAVAGSKRKKKGNDEDRIKRCRERNRIHARNSRERKKNQLEVLQRRMQQLLDEKSKLMVAPSDTSVASILMTLSGKSSSCCGSTSDESSSIFADHDVTSEEAATSSVKDYLSEIYSNPMSLSMDDFSDDIDDSDKALLSKDRSLCSSQELEMIRRERNRIHAKKTRLRKKRVLQQMEITISNLEEEVQKLKRLSTGKTEDAAMVMNSSSPVLAALMASKSPAISNYLSNKIATSNQRNLPQSQLSNVGDCSYDETLHN